MVFEQKFVPDFWGKVSGEIMRPGISKSTLHTLVKVLLSMLKRHIGLDMSWDRCPEQHAVWQE